MLVPMWLVWTLLAICLPLYLFIGYVHFALNKGTSYESNLGTDLFYLFLWPLGWVKGLIGIMAIFLPFRKRR
jgi:uncharacterized membrane protein YesL